MADTAPPGTVLVLGHVCRDLIHGDERTGGAAYFAGSCAAALGHRTTVITAAPPNHPRLAPLRDLPGVRLAIQPSAVITTFELDYSGPVRRVTLRDRAETLRPDAVDRSLLTADVAYVAPVIGECDRDLVAALRTRVTVVGAQGWLRRATEDGSIGPALLGPATDPPAVSAVVFSELDHPDSERLARHFARSARLVALTRAAKGVSLYHDGLRSDLPAAPANEVDPTGAGDVFGVVLGIMLDRGRSPADAARLAMLAAARVVEGPGLGRLLEVVDHLR